MRVTDCAPSDELVRTLHKTIAAVRDDYATLGFNTAIARLTELNNARGDQGRGRRTRAVVEQLVLMTSPLAPHICEGLWSRLGHDGSLAFEDFPVADPSLLVDDTVTCVVQIKGKVRDRLEVPSDITEDALRELALASPEGAGGDLGRDSHRDRPSSQTGQHRPCLNLLGATRHGTTGPKDRRRCPPVDAAPQQVCRGLAEPAKFSP